MVFYEVTPHGLERTQPFVAAALPAVEHVDVLSDGKQGVDRQGHANAVADAIARLLLSPAE
ncbi:hypothetical protein BH23GEM9_BH23GEM9_13130 [soil metagenome]